MSFGKGIYRRLGTLLLLAALISSPIAASAQSVDKLGSQLNNADNQVKQYQVKAEAHEHAADNLEDQLAHMRAEAAELEAKIDGIQAEINRINASIADKKEIIAGYIKQQYYAGSTSDLEILVGSDSISQFIDSEQYLETTRAKIEGLLAEIEAEKKKLDSQKQELAKEKSSLAAQQAKIKELLVKTRGEQAKYESLVAKAKASKARIERQLEALMSSGPQKSYGFVFRGQQIGREGSTGFSSGSHLHFSALVGGRSGYVSPWGYLNSGQWRMPLDNPTITQDYNAYNCNGVYANCRHNGIDMSSGFGTAVRAAASGNIIMNSWDPYGYGHFIVIDHGNGLWSLYGHMQ